MINPRYITGLDADLLEDLKKNHRLFVTLEDGILDGGFGQKIAAFYGDSDVKVPCRGLKKEFIDRFDVQELLIESRLLPEQIAQDVE